MKPISKLARHIASTATALTLIAGGLAASTTSAMANDGECAGGDFCLYEHDNLLGGRWDNYGSNMNYASGERWWGTSLTVNDQASSVHNKHSVAMGLFEHSWARGNDVYIGGGMIINHLRDYEFNDIASSNIW